MAGRSEGARGTPVPALAPLLDQAIDGSGACLVVERGEHGPMFVDAVAAEARRRGFDVRVAVGSPTTSGALEAVRSLLEVEAGSPEADVIARTGTGLDALRSLASRVDARTVDAPLLLVVDHAELVDAASARFLSYLARNLDARPVSVLLVAVEVAPGSWLEELGAALGRPPHRIRPVEAGPGADVARALLSRLPVDERRVVDALAVLGPSPSIGALTAVAGVPTAVVLATLDQLFAWGLLRRTPSGAGQLAVQSVVLDELSPTTRSELHERAAAHGRSIGEAAVHVAAHVEHVVPGSLPWAATALRAGAGLALETGDPGRAVTWLQRALEEDAVRGVEVPVPRLLELVRAQTAARDPGAAASLRLAVERTCGEQRRALQVRLGRQLSNAGRLDEAAEVLDGVLADLDPGDPAHAAVRIDARAALASTCRLSLRLRDRSACLLQALQQDVTTLGSDDAGVLAELAYEHSLAGTHREVVIDLSSRAMRTFARRPPTPAAGHALFLSLMWAEDLEGAQLLCDRLDGDAGLQPVEAHRRGALALAAGDIDVAVACARIAVADIEWVAPLLVPGARALLARALTRQGDLEAAARAMELPGGEARWRDRVTYHPILLAQAELAAARGEWRRAAALAASCAEFSRSMGTHNPAAVPWHLVSARALAELGRADDAHTVLDDAIARATAFGAPRILRELTDLRGCLCASRSAARAPVVLPPVPVAAGAPAGASAMLRLLGETVLVVDGQEHRLGDDLVDRALCIVGLAEHGVHDEALAEGLWPEGDPTVGRSRLRNVLLRVRQRHGPVVERRGRAIHLAEHVVVDVHEFDRLATEALAAADPDVAERAGQEALALHRGELCPVHPFEAWASSPRSVIRQRWLALLDRLADLAARRGDLARSLTLFEQATAAEPWDEDRYLDAVERLLAADRLAAARGLLRRCSGMCADLGVPPSARHRELAERVG